MNEAMRESSWGLPGKKSHPAYLHMGEHRQWECVPSSHLGRLATLDPTGSHSPGQGAHGAKPSPVCSPPARLQTDLEDMTDLIEMREEISNLVISAMKEAEEYQDSFERYSYLWTDDPQEFMKNFLTYGRAISREDLDSQPEETLPKTPPTLAQFQQQVCVDLAHRFSCSWNQPRPPRPHCCGGALGLTENAGELFFKRRFYYYSSMERPTDQQTATMKREFVTHGSQEEGALQAMGVASRVPVSGDRE